MQHAGWPPGGPYHDDPFLSARRGTPCVWPIHGPEGRGCARCAGHGWMCRDLPRCRKTRFWICWGRGLRLARRPNPAPGTPRSRTRSGWLSSRVPRRHRRRAAKTAIARSRSDRTFAPIATNTLPVWATFDRWFRTRSLAWVRFSGCPANRGKTSQSPCKRSLATRPVGAQALWSM